MGASAQNDDFAARNAEQYVKNYGILLYMGGVMMNVLICDDRQEDGAVLNGLLRDSGFDIKTQVFNRAHDMLEFMHTGIVVDACFLDIIMPEMSGVVLAEKLRADGFTGYIVFLSTSNDYGSDAFRVSAFDYLLKPPTAESVGKLLAKLDQDRNREDMAGILVKTAGIMKKILYRDISHVEVIKHKVVFGLTDGSNVEAYATFGEIEKRLANDARFARCHRSYIVNMDEIAEISERKISMRDGTKIPITRTYGDVKNRYYNWEFGERAEEQT